jgi:hypothetical protein
MKRMKHILIMLALGISMHAFGDTFTPVDCTNKLVNPGFDDNTYVGSAPKGWHLSVNNSPSTNKISTAAKGNNTIADSQNHWQLYQNNKSMDGKAWQKVTSLPNGQYEVGVTVVPTDLTSSEELYVYANDQKTRIADKGTFTVTAKVLDGTLELGLQFVTTGTTTLDFDNFTLRQVGEVTAEEVAQAAEAKKEAAFSNFTSHLEEARTELSTNDWPGKTAFSSAIDASAKVTKDDDLTTALKTLNQAREDYYNSQYTIAPLQQTVSYVDLSKNGSEKYVLKVGGRPYYGTEIQVRIDKLRGYNGWTDAECEAAVKRAADDGFNTLSIPLFWVEVEPEKDYFDWHTLDQYLGWCHKYGVKMELLWFSWSSGGRVQYLNNYNGNKKLRTPDYVCSMDGTSDYNVLNPSWEYSLDWRDTNLRDRETYVLQRVMDHVALWDANNGNPHTVIGVQLGNEAEGHGGNSATAQEVVDYYNNVGKGVKESKYVTWTRMNCVSYETSGRTSANENNRSKGGTNIDFVGIDQYGTNASSVKGNLGGQLGENGKNFRMIMEIDAKDANSPLYQMAALAGDKAFDYYNLGFVDGNGLYTNDSKVNNGHTLVERSHINLVRQRNAILNMDNQGVAVNKQGGSLYVYNYAGTSSSTETGLNSITFTPDQSNTQAIAVKHSDREYALLSTLGGTFTLPSTMTVAQAQKGRYDASGRWVKEDDVTLNGQSLTMPETSCVRLILTSSNDDSDWQNAVQKVANYKEANYPYADSKLYNQMTQLAANRPADYVNAADSLKAAVRRYVESNAMASGVAGSVDCTSLLSDPDGATGAGWQFSGLSVSANDAMAYITSNGSKIPNRLNAAWNSSAQTLTASQQLAELPKGSYLLSFGLRGDIKSVSLNGTTATYNNLSTFSDAAGWDDVTIPFIQDATGKCDLNVTVVATWASLGHFRLVKLPVTLNEEATEDPTTYDEKVNVVLHRSFAADNWNSLVLPFDLSAEQLQALGKDVKVATLSSVSQSDGNYTLNFNTTTDEGIKANTPVLVWGADATASSFLFKNVILSNVETTPQVTVDGVSFIGTYKESNTQEGDYFVSKDNKFYQATGAQPMKGTRAVFRIAAQSGAKLTGFTVDGQTTGIVTLNDEEAQATDRIYNVAGQQVDKAYKGIVIVKGKKIINR